MTHGTYIVVQLTASPIARSPSTDVSLIGCQLESAVAANLATGLREFTISCDYQSVPCSASPRSATRNLVVLFGPAAGSVTISTRIEPLNLPAFKRRALVLLALDLLAMVLLALDLASTALTDGFHRRGPAMSKVELHAVTTTCARLAVQHNGGAMQAAFP